MKHIFITGVSSGIGRALATAYLQMGHTVLGVSRRDPREIGADRSDSGDTWLQRDRFKFAAVDLADAANARSALQDLLRDTRVLDLVVLNAGILGTIADMSEQTLDDLHHIMDVNVWANKVVLDAVLQPGRTVRQVVAISSGAAVNGNRGWGGYAISKAALNMLVQLYAREQPSTHFCALAPGLVDTAMQDYLCGLPDDSRYDSLQALKSRRGTSDMPTPDQLAPRLIDKMQRLPHECPSGEFVDIRLQ